MFHLLVAWLAAIAAFLAAALCIAWSPFAALICARIARRNGLSARRYAMYGAMYSALLFLPWRHLTRQMRGEPVFINSIRGAYRIVYALAALLLACHIYFAITESGIFGYSDAQLLSLFESLVLAVLTAAGTLALGAGMVSVFRAYRRFTERDGRQEPHNSIDMLDRSYIAPFAWAWASMMIGSSFWFLWLAIATYNDFLR